MCCICDMTYRQHRRADMSAVTSADLDPRAWDRFVRLISNRAVPGQIRRDDEAAANYAEWRDAVSEEERRGSSEELETLPSLEDESEAESL
jgi:hypothetical protein